MEISDTIQSMFWNRYFLPSFALMVFIAVLHWIGALSDYYSTTEWYDIPMHFMGGAWVALFGLWVTGTSYGAFLGPFVNIRNLFLYTLAVGVAWEFLELALEFNSLGDVGYWPDTMLDLVMDLLGTSVVVGIYKKTISAIK